MSRLAKTLAQVLALVSVLTFAAMVPASAVSVRTYEKQVVDSTNAYRAEHGRSSVRLQSCVDRWANGQARWMAQHQKLQHRKGRLMKVVKDCKLTAASENIAWNYSSGTTAVAAWSRSPGHAANMKAAKNQYIGVGVARSKNGQWYVAQLFGTRK
jgi:uncharacterized protein YkwD